nr:hypothetical protein [uncultured bacterium]AQS30232.1 hypothetical protein [uncultured bacterium]
MKYPKIERYSLGQMTQAKILELVECVLTASSTPERSRVEILFRASALLDLVKLQIRLGYEVQALNEKYYLTLQTKLQEIGKMLGGWIKTTTKGAR